MAKELRLGVAERLKARKTALYRRLKYWLRRPEPPSLPSRFQGPVVVVGSAPKSEIPVGFDESYTVLTVNGSQTVSSKWGATVPDITFMMFNQVEGTTPNAREVRRVLTGKRTKALYVMLWRRKEMERLRQGLQTFDYVYERLEIVDRYQRMALMDKVAGLSSLELDADSKCSNGMNAVLFALYHGATAVIISGINPNSSGHVYNQAGLKRHHTDMDMRLIQRLLELDYPLYTADPDVGARTGMPVWNGAISAPLTNEAGRRQT